MYYYNLPFTNEDRLDQNYANNKWWGWSWNQGTSNLSFKLMLNEIC